MTAPGSRARAWLGLAAVSVGLACVGEPPPPPAEATTSTAGTTSTLSTGEGEPTTGDATTSAPDPGDSTTSSGSSSSDGDACTNIECPRGEQCDDGECIACARPSCAVCADYQSCQCPGVDPCCEQGMCIGTLCDPLAQDCPDGEGCYGFENGWICAQDQSGAMGASGDSCGSLNACDPGLVCLDAQVVPDCVAASCCSPLCDVTVGAERCPAGQLCTPWYEPAVAPAGYEDVGACMA